jgi:hypothetical protein
MLWRLGGRLLKARGNYYDFYQSYKTYLHRRFAAEGVRVMPTPQGRTCIFCEKNVTLKKGRYCPDCGNSLSTKEEPYGIRWEGHVHMMCMRRMLQLFLSHLWAVWRERLGLPLRTPYPIEFLGHSTIISPWDMADR